MSLNCMEGKDFIVWIRIQAPLKPFLLSSSFCQRIHPKTLPSISRSGRQILLSINFPKNSRIVSQCSGHQFWHFKTTVIELLCINVYPFSFIDRNWIGWQLYNKFWSWLGLCDRFPCAGFQWVFLRTFLWCICWCHSQCEPTKLFGLETMIRSWCQCNNVLRDHRVSHPRLGQSSYLNESTLSVEMLWSFENECILGVLSAWPQILPQVSLCWLCWALRFGVSVGTLSRHHQRFPDHTFGIIQI